MRRFIAARRPPPEAYPSTGEASFATRASDQQVGDLFDLRIAPVRLSLAPQHTCTRTRSRGMFRVASVSAMFSATMLRHCASGMSGKL